MSTPSVVSCEMQVAFEEREPPILQPASPVCALSLEEDVPVPTSSEEHVIDIGTDLEPEPAAMDNICESTPLLVPSSDLSCTNVSAPCDNLISNFDHVVVLTHKEVLARIPSNDIVYSIMLKEPLSLRCAMNKISEISYLNSSTHAYCFMFYLIGEYSMNDNFLVDHICITCDRINALKLDVLSPICYVSQSFCCGTLDYVRDSMQLYSGLVDLLQPTNILLPVLECSNSARIESDFSYPLSLSQHMLHLYATKMYFTYTCNLSCLMYSRHIFHVNKNNTTCYVYIYSAYTLFFLFLPLSAYPKPRTAFLEEREDDEDTIMDHADFECLSWKEILSLIDDYYKVNSFLVEKNVLISPNYILPKSDVLCCI
jgi:hypothetical protein